MAPNQPVPGTLDGQRVVAWGLGDLNPLKYLGGAVQSVVSDGWQFAMTSLWSCGLWLMSLVFKFIDGFVTPDLSTTGPERPIYELTFWIGAALAGLLFFVQIGLLAFRHDGRTLGETLVGMAQFAVVWVGFLGFATTIVTAMAGLEKGILSVALGVNSFSAFDNTGTFPQKVTDSTTATVLGFSAIFLIIPAAFSYLLIMVVREAGLIVLAATSPITSAGLLAEVSRNWFWKSLRWFLAAAAIAPVIALVFGIGVGLSKGVLQSSGTTSAQAQVGMGVIGAVLFFIAALSPIVLFKLLAFVDPNTASGAAMRSSMSANGGIGGLLSGGGAAGGSSAASQSADDGSGASAGEASAQASTLSRFTGALSAGADKIAGIADKASALGESVLGGAGVGHGGQGEGSGGQSGGSSSGHGGGRSDSDDAAGSGDSASAPTPTGAPSVDVSAANPSNAGSMPGPKGSDGSNGADGADGAAGPAGPTGAPGSSPLSGGGSGGGGAAGGGAADAAVVAA